MSAQRNTQSEMKKEEESEKMERKMKTEETPLGCMPHDLLFEILCKLPLASVCKFKCVSKPWCSLIKSPIFGCKFSSKIPSQPFQWVFGSWGDPNVKLYSVDPQHGYATLLEEHHLEHEPYEIKFCDGLICHTVRASSCLYVYNPTTKKNVALPSPNFRSIGPPSFGFGFDPSSNKYKVLCWMKIYSSLREFQVISLGLGAVDSQWKSLQTPSNIRLFRGEPVLASGSLFWFKNGDAQITSFSLATEKFRVIALPNNMNGFFTHTLFVSQDTLYLAEQPVPKRPLDDKSMDHLMIVNMWMLKNTVKTVWVRLMSNVSLPMEGTTLREYYFCYGSVGAPHNARFSTGNGDIAVLANDHKDHYLFIYCFLSGFKRIKLRGEPLPGTALRYHGKNNVVFNTN